MFHPRAYTATPRAIAALVTSIAQRRLVSPTQSQAMYELMKAGARAVGTWTGVAFDGFDDPTDSSKRRSVPEIAGKIGYLTGNASTFERVAKNLTAMADAAIVRTSTSRYVLTYAIPFFRRVIPMRDTLPLIRQTHDCVQGRRLRTPTRSSP